MKKIVELIKERIQEEIKDQNNLSNLHGVDLTKSLIEPYRETFEVAFAEDETIELSVVLRENVSTLRRVIRLHATQKLGDLLSQSEETKSAEYF